MAGISRDGKTGRPIIRFTGADGKRQTIRLGKATMKQAESAKPHVEDLLTCRATGAALRPATADWVGSVGDVIYGRLERTGLVGPRETGYIPPLGEWLDSYIAGQRAVKPGTRTCYGHARQNLLDFFGKDRRLDGISAGGAEDFRTYLATDAKLSESTVRRRCRWAKQFFRAAVRRKLIVENPFDEMKNITDRGNKTRERFISPADAEAVLKACAGAEWRLVFALCRYGGLRCPSEVKRLTWADVNWEKMRFTVHASKTEHQEDQGIRLVPIFPELLPYLRDAFEQAEPGAVYCCPQYANARETYRQHILHFIEQAGLKPWPKLFQNLRSTRQTELTESFAMHVVCAWIGNSPRVATKHYLQVTEEHFRQGAGQSAPKTEPAPSGTERIGPHPSPTTPTFRAFAAPCDPLQLCANLAKIQAG